MNRFFKPAIAALCLSALSQGAFALTDEEYVAIAQNCIVQSPLANYIVTVQGVAGKKGIKNGQTVSFGFAHNIDGGFIDGDIFEMNIYDDGSSNGVLFRNTTRAKYQCP